MRCAIFFVPPADHALSAAAARWLCRDIYSGARIATTIEGLTETDHAFLTALPRRYGFHATLKAPFRLAESCTVQQLERHLVRYSSTTSPLSFAVKIALIESFFAIVPVKREPELDLLAAQIVTEFDSYRLPPNDTEIARRNVTRLNSQQLSNLMTWGYPHVFDQFRFHMTLTGPIDHMERDHVAQVLTHHFCKCDFLLELSQIVLAIEPEPGAPFVVHSAHRLGALRERRIA